MRPGAIALCLTFVSVAAAEAQRATPRFDGDRDTLQVQVRSGWYPLRLAKWGTLAGSTAAAVYGFLENRVADRDYERLERECSEMPSLCARVPGADEYADPALEARYQRILTRDDRAKLALIAGQVGIAASVLLFILDLPDRTITEDIPYDPKPVHLERTSDGGVQLQVQLPVGKR